MTTILSLDATHVENSGRNDSSQESMIQLKPPFSGKDRNQATQAEAV